MDKKFKAQEDEVTRSEVALKILDVPVVKFDYKEENFNIFETKESDKVC